MGAYIFVFMLIPICKNRVNKGILLPILVQLFRQKISLGVKERPILFPGLVQILQNVCEND